MNTTMIERFNVSGALLVKLFGQPMREVAAFEEKAGRVRDIGVTQSMYARCLLRLAGPDRSRSPPPSSTAGAACSPSEGALDVGTVVALTAYLNRLYGPLTALSNVHVDVMTALVSLRARLRGPRPAADGREKPDAVAAPARSGARSSSTTSTSRYPTGRGGLARLARVGGGARPGALGAGAARRELHRRARASSSRSSGPRAPARRRSASSCRASTTCAPARCASTASTCATPRSTRCARTVGVVTQDAHLFHDTIRANLLYAQPGRDRRRPRATRCAPRRSCRSSSRCPTGLDTVVGDRGYRLSGRREAAARDRPPAAQGARHRRPRRGHGAPRLGVRAAPCSGRSRPRSPAGRRS